jgi:pyruvate dehydrogenase E2 component (dihydrolipoamide acetyltransferase)
MEVGTIANWNKQEGDSFSAGDSLCAIETDKASVDFEAQDDGIIAKILREGVTAQDIAVGTPICVVVEEAGDVAAFADFVAESDEPKLPAPAATVQPTPASSPPPPPPVDRDAAADFVLMPSARHLSQSKGVDATGLQGTGKGGRVTKGDVLQALANGTTMPPLSTPHAAANTAAPSSTPPPVVVPQVAPVSVTIAVVDTHGAFEDIANNKMRKIIASRLTESKSTVPHFYISMEVELDGVMKLRKNLAKNHDIKISVNDLIIRSSALALRDVPEVNASYNPKTKEVALQNTIDISVAVATPTGLITPIVPGTDKMGLAEITSTVKDLAGRARDGKLQPHEYQGGTFCISNLGMFGINEFSAVINPPQAAIMAVGGGTKRIVPTPYVDGAEEQAKPSIKTIMTARLSADRRVVDEATAALFLQAFRHYMNKPELLLL